MTKQLFSLYLNSASEVLQLPEGNKLQLGGNSGEGGKRKARAKAWVWVASEALVCSSVELPRGGGTSAEVIGYSLEDNLIEPIENYHLVLAARKSGQAAVMALSHKQMQQWCEALYIAERLPLGLFPDFLALPWKAGGASLHLSPQRALVRSDKFYGFATSPKLLDAVFSKLELEPEQVRVLLEPGTQLPALLVDCSQVEEYPFWQLLSAQGAPDKKSNLYQGVYTKPKGNKSFSLRPLVAGLVYACLAGGLWLGNEVQSSLTMLEQSQRYQRENRELLAMMLPEINMRAPDWREQAIKAVEAMHGARAKRLRRRRVLAKHGKSQQAHAPLRPLPDPQPHLPGARAGADFLQLRLQREQLPRQRRANTRRAIELEYQPQLLERQRAVPKPAEAQAMNGLLIWWVSRSVRERVLLVLGLLCLLAWSGYTYGWLRYLDWQQQISSTYQETREDRDWLELLRGQIYDLHREGKVLSEQGFESTVRQVLAEYASTTQLQFNNEDEQEIYQMRWRGENPDDFIAALQQLGQLGGEIRTLRMRRGRSKISEAYAEVLKR